MKKTAILAVALATCLGYAPAQAAEVVSSNIVGYEKVSLQKGFNMVGVQFVKVGGEDLDLMTVGVLDDQMAGYDEDGVYATEMRMWTGNGYTTYGWSGTSGTDVDEDPTLDNKWLDRDNEEIDEIASPSTGFWIVAEKAGTMTISGEVPATDTVSVQLTAGFNMVANPYPGEVAITSFGTLDSSFAGYDEDGVYATEMRVWTGNGYTTYGWSGTSGTDVDEDPTLDNKWLDRDNEEVTVTIPFGTAVWIYAEKAGTLTFSAPKSGN